MVFDVMRDELGNAVHPVTGDDSKGSGPMRLPTKFTGVVSHFYTQPERLDTLMPPAGELLDSADELRWDSLRWLWVRLIQPPDGEPSAGEDGQIGKVAHRDPSEEQPTPIRAS